MSPRLPAFNMNGVEGPIRPSRREAMWAKPLQAAHRPPALVQSSELWGSIPIQPCPQASRQSTLLGGGEVNADRGLAYLPSGGETHKSRLGGQVKSPTCPPRFGNGAPPPRNHADQTPPPPTRLRWSVRCWLVDFVSAPDDKGESRAIVPTPPRLATRAKRPVTRTAQRSRDTVPSTAQPREPADLRFAHGLQNLESLGTIRNTDTRPPRTTRVAAPRDS